MVGWHVVLRYTNFRSQDSWHVIRLVVFIFAHSCDYSPVASLASRA